ncbi:MAG: heat-inducible transcription repressor HrcA [Candidatus Hydrogenedentes bacterium]|nr:heat-inducible transcription repressor HrcA [Candidatus Hydrogenedentota bacterium]
MNQPPDLNDREAQVLHAVVHSYITTAEPVGSRSLVKRFGMTWSPATVRNVMADLEEMGYLEQLHTSSGRIPTTKGYRYYVDHLMHVQELTLREREMIEHDLTQRLNDADDVLRHTSHLLALITHQAGFAEAPNGGRATVKRLDFLPISAERLAVLIVDNYGRVHTLTVYLDQPISAADLGPLSQFLNEHLEGISIDQLAARVEQKMRSFWDEQRRLAELALAVLNHVPKQRPNQLFLDGTSQLFQQPEFKDFEKARDMFGLFEEQDRIVDMMRRAALDLEAEKQNILIGREQLPRGLEDISLVASPYKVDGQTVGLIGILGPRRMPYNKLTAIVDYTAHMVSRVLTRLSS